VSPFEELVTAIEQHTSQPGRRNGKHIRLLCPAHDDHHPSLDVAEGTDGTPLVVCRSHGCSYEQVLAAVGLAPSDLHQADDREWTPFGPAIAVYRYVDERGELLFEVCRTAGKEFPQRRPDPTAASGWRWKLGATRRVLYRLPQLLEAVAAGRVIFVAEGEKDVHSLERLGLVATCNAGGAGNWNQPSYADTLADAPLVVVLPDDDDEGRAHAAKIARSLAGRAEVRLVELWPAGQTKRDVTDWIIYAGDEARPLLEALVQDRPAYAGEPATLAEDPTVTFAEFVANRDDEQRDPLISTADHGTLLPAGGFALLAATIGHGKTTWVAELVQHAAAGRDYNGLRFPRPLRVLVIENEGPREAFREKIERRLAIWEHGGEPRIWDVPTAWGQIRISDETLRAVMRVVVERHRVDLVVSDSLTRFGVRGNGTPEETREFVDWLTELGLGRDLAFLLLHHPRTRVEPGEGELERIAGAWPPHADLILLLKKLDGSRARLSFVKTRWAKGIKPPSILSFDAETESFTYIGDDLPADRDLVAELIDKMANGDWWTANALKKKKPAGVGADLDKIKAALADERFEMAAGKTIGKRSGSIYYRLANVKEASSPPNDAHDATTLWAEKGDRPANVKEASSPPNDAHDATTLSAEKGAFVNEASSSSPSKRVVGDDASFTDAPADDAPADDGWRE
jgi:hypothetical protein